MPAMTAENDQDLQSLRRVLAGQPAALLDLYDRHASLIFAQAFASLGDRLAAEDVVQETFTDAWFEIKAWFSAPRDVLEWLLEIARTRLATRTPAAQAAVPAPTLPLPRSLRDRVLDSIYGAGERLLPPYPVSQWARREKKKR
jgi:RNA polymerase sigma-70 factor (ECF subfamily)